MTRFSQTQQALHRKDEHTRPTMCIIYIVVLIKLLSYLVLCNIQEVHGFDEFDDNFLLGGLSLQSLQPVIIDAAPDTGYVVHLSQADLLLRVGRFADAAKTYEHVISEYKLDEYDTENAAPIRLTLGHIYTNMSLYESAEFEFLHAASISRKWAPSCHYALGLLYARTGRTLDAIASMETALYYKPDFFAALHDIGSLYIVRGEINRGMHYWEEALESLFRAGIVSAADMESSAQQSANFSEHLIFHVLRVFSSPIASAKIDRTYIRSVGLSLTAFLRRLSHLDLRAFHRGIGYQLLEAGSYEEGLRHLQQASSIAPETYGYLLLHATLALPIVYNDLDDIYQHRAYLSQYIYEALSDRSLLIQPHKLVDLYITLYQIPFAGLPSHLLVRDIARLFRSSDNPVLSYVASWTYRTFANALSQATTRQVYRLQAPLELVTLPDSVFAHELPPVPTPPRAPISSHGPSSDAQTTPRLTLAEYRALHVYDSTCQLQLSTEQQMDLLENHWRFIYVPEWIRTAQDWDDEESREERYSAKKRRAFEGDDDAEFDDGEGLEEDGETPKKKRYANASQEDSASQSTPMDSKSTATPSAPSIWNHEEGIGCKHKTTNPSIAAPASPLSSTILPEPLRSHATGWVETQVLLQKLRENLHVPARPMSYFDFNRTTATHFFPQWKPQQDVRAGSSAASKTRRNAAPNTNPSTPPFLPVSAHPLPVTVKVGILSYQMFDNPVGLTYLDLFKHLKGYKAAHNKAYGNDAYVSAPAPPPHNSPAYDMEVGLTEVSGHRVVPPNRTLEYQLENPAHPAASSGGASGASGVLGSILDGVGQKKQGGKAGRTLHPVVQCPASRLIPGFESQPQTPFHAPMSYSNLPCAPVLEGTHTRGGTLPSYLTPAALSELQGSRNYTTATTTKTDASSEAYVDPMAQYGYTTIPGVEAFDTTLLLLRRSGDSTTQEILRHVDRYLLVSRPEEIASATPGFDVEYTRALIGKLGLDVLIIADPGIHADLFTLLYSRLAPVQILHWASDRANFYSPGAPDTVDYVVVGDSSAPTDFQRSASEQIVRLGDLGLKVGPLPPLQEEERFRAVSAHGLLSQTHTYVVPATLSHLHPSFDSVLISILKADPLGEVLLFHEPNQDLWLVRLRRRLLKHPNMTQEVYSRIRFIQGGQAMVPREQLALLASADVVLDPFPVGLDFSVSDVFTLGVPVITCPSLQPGRKFVAPLYETLETLDTVVPNAAAYIAKAVELVNNRTELAALRKRVLARMPLLHWRSPMNSTEQESFQFYVHQQMATDSQDKTTVRLSSEGIAEPLHSPGNTDGDSDASFFERATAKGLGHSARATLNEWTEFLGRTARPWAEDREATQFEARLLGQLTDKFGDSNGSDLRTALRVEMKRLEMERYQLFYEHGSDSSDPKDSATGDSTTAAYVNSPEAEARRYWEPDSALLTNIASDAVNGADSNGKTEVLSWSEQRKRAKLAKKRRELLEKKPSDIHKTYILPN